MEKLKKKRRAFVLLMALAAVMASPPDMWAQGTDAYFEAQDFGDGYAYGFSHEGFGGDLIYNFTHQTYGDDYNYAFSHQMYGDDYIYGFSHQIYGSDYIYWFTHEGFGDDYTGSFSHQGFGQPVPLGSGIIVLLAAGAAYSYRVTRRPQRTWRSQRTRNKKKNN
jgi:hypothetical protein